MKISLSILLFVTWFHSFSQKKVIYILDEDKKAIPFVSCYFMNSLIYADANGQISIKDILGKKVLFKCIGYSDQEKLIDKSIDTVVLTKKTYKIPEVTVNAEPELLEFGFHNKPTNSYQTGNIANTIGVKIEGNGNHSKIETIILDLKKISKGYKLKLHFFDVSKSSNKEGNVLLPGDLLFTKEFITPNSKGKQKVDVSEDNIYFTDAIVVALQRDLEYINNEKLKNPYFKNGGIKITYEHSKANSYIFVKNRWVIFPGPEGRVYNFKIGAIVSQ